MRFGIDSHGGWVAITSMSSDTWAVDRIGRELNPRDEHRARMVNKPLEDEKENSDGG